MSSPKTIIQRVAIVDFTEARTRLKNSLSLPSIDFSILLDTAPSLTKKERDEQQKDHCIRVKSQLQRLKELQETSQKSPIHFDITHKIPDWLVFHQRLENSSGYKYFLFRERIYHASGPNTSEEFELLVYREFEREDSLFENLKSKFLQGKEETSKSKRKSISEKVRRMVWRRDQGSCVRCGSRENIEYDHIIPVVKGGGSSIRNIELLCEMCNRKKGAHIE